MRCTECRGACCESFTVLGADLRLPSPDVRRWLALHAVGGDALPITRAELTFECRCTALTPSGRCGIYADRPDVCRDFAPGGADCLWTVRTRRTPADYVRIREAFDPETIHG